MTLHRRDFLLTSTASGLACVGSTPLWGAPQAGKYRTALIGSGWWGMNILREAIQANSAKVVALCDPDSKALNVCADQVNDLTGDSPKKYPDYRELLDKEKPEVVIIASPDHWHALQTIAALKAGSHVFVEKPTGHTVGESQAMLKVARQADRVVQVGLHRRIGPHHVSAMQALKDGLAGKVGMVRMFVHGGGGPEPASPNTPTPKGMDWDLYCGPSPLRPFNTKIHPGGWRNYLDFANGTLGDWGVHWLDQVLLWSGEKGPKRVFSTGGRPVRGEPILNDKEQTSDAPDAQVATFEFDSFTAIWEHRRFAENHAEKHKIGCYFYGTKGTLHIGWRDGWTFYPTNAKEATKHEASKLQEPDGHNLKLLWADFLTAIEKKQKPIADIEVAHNSTTAVLLGMLSYKLKRSIAWDVSKEQIVNDAEASTFLKRKYRAPWQYPELS